MGMGPMGPMPPGMPPGMMPGPPMMGPGVKSRPYRLIVDNDCLCCRSATHDGWTSPPWDDWASGHEASHVQTSDVERSESLLCFVLKIFKITKITEDLLLFSCGEIVLFKRTFPDFRVESLI